MLTGVHVKVVAVWILMHIELSKKLFDDQTSFCADTRFLVRRKWRVILREYPTLIVEFSYANRNPVQIKMICENWDDLPPSITVLDGEGNVMSQQQFPKGHGVFNGSSHPKTQQPFICAPGSLAYHQHSSHINDVWENYKIKSGYDLGGILTRIWNAWKLTT